MDLEQLSFIPLLESSPFFTLLHRQHIAERFIYTGEPVKLQDRHGFEESPPSLHYLHFTAINVPGVLRVIRGILPVLATRSCATAFVTPDIL